VWIRLPPYISSLLQSRNDASNRTGGQASDCRQFAAGYRTSLTQQVEALVISWAQPQALGK